jgi:hypothetical protein
MKPTQTQANLLLEFCRVTPWVRALDLCRIYELGKDIIARLRMMPISMILEASTLRREQGSIASTNPARQCQIELGSRPLRPSEKLRHGHQMWNNDTSNSNSSNNSNPYFSTPHPTHPSLSSQITSNTCYSAPSRSARNIDSQLLQRRSRIQIQLNSIHLHRLFVIRQMRVALDTAVPHNLQRHDAVLVL